MKAPELNEKKQTTEEQNPLITQIEELANTIKELEEEKENILTQVEKTRDIQAEQIDKLEQENTDLDKKLDEATDILEDNDKVIKQLTTDVSFWKTASNNYLLSLQRLTAENDSLKLSLEQLRNNPIKLSQEVQQSLQEANQTIRELQEQNNLLKLGYSNGTKPQLRTIPIPTFMTERDKQIIQQAQAHLEPLINTTTLRERILQTEETGTKEAYWGLHSDLTGAGLYLDKLIQFYQGDLDQVHSFTYTLGAILRGERLENIQEN